jgi:4-hydroxythreonine-4-phosphate dehydrogenase
MNTIQNIEQDNVKRVKVGISMGDANGIGFEIIFKCLSDARILDSITPIIYGSSKVASFHRKLLNMADFNFNTIRNADEAVAKRVNLVNCHDKDVKIDLGLATDIAGELSYKSLESAVADLKSKKIEALVTAPINKYSIQAAGFKFPGHTEYLAASFNCKNYLMLMVSDHLRVGVATGHLPISQVAPTLTLEVVLEKLQVLNNSLRNDFFITRPRIAVLGLNPHAGETGVLGMEEQQIIIPAIKAGNEKKILAFGPFPADGFFGSTEWKKYDGVLAMYHDQGMIPFKSMAFESGVNYTAGLPVVRTSPDHGTGYNIAGKDQASPVSFREALFLAADIVRNRQTSDAINKNPLKTENCR